MAMRRRGGCHKEDVKMWKCKEREKERLDNIREDIKEYKMREDMAQNRSMWHMKTNAVPLHGGGLLGEKKCLYFQAYAHHTRGS